MAEKISIENGVQGTIIHPTYDDRRFKKFGIELEADMRKRREIATGVISGQVSSAIRNCYQRTWFRDIKSGLTTETSSRHNLVKHTPSFKIRLLAY